MIKQIFKILILFGIFILSLSLGFSTEILITNDETVFVTKIDSSRISLEAIGELNIFNPTLNSDIYEYSFVFRDDIIFNIFIDDDTILTSSSKLVGRDILANSSKKINYKLTGVISKNSYNDFISKNISLFEWYKSNSYFDPLKYASLNKLDRENQNSTNVSYRRVYVKTSNPTEFNVNINYINLYKTNTTDLSFKDSDNLLDIFKGENIKPNQNLIFKYDDNFSDDSTVYWIEFKVVTKPIFSSVREIVFIEKSPDGNSGGSNGGGRFDLLQPLLISKLSSLGIVRYGDELGINLIIQNPNSFEVNGLKVFDSFPTFFELVQNPSLNNLIFDLGNILPYETKEINYDLDFVTRVDEDLIYFPYAKLKYDLDDVSFSNSLNLINDVDDSSKKLFIEKNINYVNNETTVVTIVVKNIGTEILEDLLITDFNDNNLSQRFEWKIHRLDINSQWETTYQINSSKSDVSLPEVYGVPDTKVYKTIIINSGIKSSPIKSELQTFQKILIGLGITLLIIDILF